MTNLRRNIMLANSTQSNIGGGNDGPGATQITEYYYTTEYSHDGVTIYYLTGNFDEIKNIIIDYCIAYGEDYSYDDIIYYYIDDITQYGIFIYVDDVLLQSFEYMTEPDPINYNMYYHYVITEKNNKSYYIKSACILVQPNSYQNIGVKTITYNLIGNQIRLFYDMGQHHYAKIYVTDYDDYYETIPAYSNSIICDEFYDDFYKTGIKSISNGVDRGNIIFSETNLITFDNLPKYLIEE